MNGADPTTPEEIERIMRSVELPKHRFDEDADDFAALMRMLSTPNALQNQFFSPSH
jgi:hypothetical protein